MKTFLTIIVFIIAIILIAFSISLFFQTNEQLRYESCVLLQNPQTKKVDCFGCVADKCKDAPADWIIYEKPETGIPYACFEGESGCELAQ